MWFIRGGGGGRRRSICSVLECVVVWYGRGTRGKKGSLGYMVELVRCNALHGIAWMNWWYVYIKSARVGRPGMSVSCTLAVVSHYIA